MNANDGGHIGTLKMANATVHRTNVPYTPAKGHPATQAPHIWKRKAKDAHFFFPFLLFLPLFSPNSREPLGPSFSRTARL